MYFLIRHNLHNLINVYYFHIVYQVLLQNSIFISTSFFTYQPDLKSFIRKLGTKFDIICIFESRLSQKNPQTTNITLVGNNINRHQQNHQLVVSCCIYLKSSPINYVKTYKSTALRNLKQLLSNLLFQTNQNSL